MCSNSFIDILEKHIIKIFNENDIEVKFNNISLKNEKRKFSSVLSTVLYIDDKPLSGKEMKTYKIIYKCRCNRENKILLHKYLKKDKIVCQHCLQDETFTDYFIIPNSIKHKGNKHIGKKIRNTNFDLESDEFKKKFFNSHLTNDEFYKYLPYIYQINDIIINKEIINNIQYKLFPTNNQMRYTYKIGINNNFETIKSVYLKCCICNKIHKIHICNLRNKNLNELKCNNCLFQNYKYKIKLYDETGLTYQSKPEKMFIDLCKENNIQIQNGIKIPYTFNNQQHIYISDFYLPEFKYIVEIKGNNIWYKRDLKTGKIDAKRNATIEFGIKYGFQYKFVFEQEINEFIKNILNERDSLGIGDNSGEIKSSQN